MHQVALSSNNYKKIIFKNDVESRTGSEIDSDLNICQKGVLFSPSLEIILKTVFYNQFRIFASNISFLT